MQRVMLARAWRISPADLRACTLKEIAAMKLLLTIEKEARDG